MDPAIIALCIFCVIGNIYDIKEHNKNVDQTWPDSSDQRQRNMHDRFKIGSGGNYFLLVLLVCFLIKEILGVIF